MRCTRQTRKPIHFLTERKLPHPERETNPEKEDVLINEWEFRIWKFRRAVEIIIFDEDPEYEDDEDLKRVLKDRDRGVLPAEYYEYLIGALDKYPHDLPVNWLLAREIIKEIIAVQARNDSINRQSQSLASAGDNRG
jgi:hypothetical protein